ncbi:MAG: alpha/beta hydrolase [Acidobacteria bacterium]|nr:alpha/beta hydrolase [Acidobacteriota bacterium]
MLSFSAIAFSQTSPAEGDWEGVLKLPSAQLRLRLHLKAAPSGLAGTMDSVDQNAFGLPISDVTFTAGTLKWQMPQLRASFEGQMNAAGNEIAGNFTQGMALPLTLKRMDPAAAASAGPKRPQMPQPPFPYTAADVAFPSKSSGVTLAGTLTMPAGKGPHPALILVTGSGPQDRDESLMGHKPFLVLADCLTRQGIAVLRYDDRGIGKSTGSFATATSLDFSMDAEGALDFLKTRPDINAKSIGIAGHSEGGIIAPMVAARRSDVAFIVLLAGTAVTGADVILEQGQAIARVSGATEEQLKAARAKQLEFTRIMNSTSDPGELEKKLREFLAGAPNADAQIRQLTSPWMRFFMTYDPAPTLAKVKCPVLALNGEKDLQVLPDQNLPPMKAALEKGGNKDVTILRLPSLNHLFQSAKTGAVSEYAQIEETMSPAALEAIAKWVRTKSGLEK